MILTGTLVNALGVAAGAGAGMAVRRLFRRGVPEELGDMLVKGMGMCTIYIAASHLLDGSRTLVTVFALVLGVLLGNALDLDGKIRRLSAAVERRFFREGGSFAQGFLSSTLIFCVGTMAVTGALESGLQNRHDILFAKAVMDLVIAVVMGSSLGVGVLFSAVPVFLYQGAIALLASVAEPYLGSAVIAEMNTVGSLLLFGVSLDLLDIKHLRLMNYIPAMFFPILLCLLPL